MRQAPSVDTLKQRKDTFLRRGRFRWPYIKYSSYLAQPDTLAAAGFSFNPVKDAPDNVQCFHCGFELTGWEPTDDPFSEHYSHQPSCKYAQLHCQTRASKQGGNIEWVGWPLEADQGLAPDEMEKEREKMTRMRGDQQTRKATFERGAWPHAGRMDWNVTPERLSKAGFYFTPEWPGDDTATCAFCGYALAEWEPEDDPNTEHARRAPDCLFFKLGAAEPVQESNGKEMTQKRTGKRVSDAVTVDDSEADDGDTDSSQTSKRQRLGNATEGDGTAEEQSELESEEESEEESEGQEQDGGNGEYVGSEAEGDKDYSSGDEQIPETANTSLAVDDDNDDADGEEEEEEEREEEEEETHLPQVSAEACSEKQDSDGQDQPEEDSDMMVSMSKQTSAETDASMSESTSEAQLPSTQTPASPSDMQIYDSVEEEAHEEATQQTQQSTQVDDSAAPPDSIVDQAQASSGSPLALADTDDAEVGEAWELTEEEEGMTVEEFIRACCNQKVASLEASAAQMISSFMQRAEDTRDRIDSVSWQH